MIDPSQPPIVITEHDMLKVKMVEHLTAALGMSLALATAHSEARYRNGLLQVARKLAQLVDGLEWESAGLREWWSHERQSVWVERMTGTINANDVEGVRRMAEQMQFQHPLPRLVVGNAS
jgi:hypothetical protein